MTWIRVLGSLDPNMAWDGIKLYQDDDFRHGSRWPYELRGAAATVRAGPGDNWRILRDPLGLNKLFWARAEDGHVDFAARPQTLVAAGHAFNRISAVPRGCVGDLGPDQSEGASGSLVPDWWFSSQRRSTLGVQEAGRKIRSHLEAYIEAIAVAHPAAPVFVCLSGGLDSSGIAAVVRDHFPTAAAVSFDLDRPRNQASEDRRVARRLARDLGMPLLEVTVSHDELLAHLDTVLLQGIDWRDFNVHAALVNAAIAAAIDDSLMAPGPIRPAIVMTGDLVNEYLVDYHAERYKDETYYELPRLPVLALRSSLVRGLDTCHREVGVFAAWGLSVVQPYAVAVDAYLALDAELLGREDRKQRLCQDIFGSRLPDYVYSRPKVRAQVGDPDTGEGVLAACIDRGLDAAWLRRRFADLHAVEDQRALDRFIRAGRYRTALPSPFSEVQ